MHQLNEPPAWVERWIGLPFEDRGRGPRAFDCWGLARAVLFERRGVELPSWDDYETTDDVAAIAIYVSKHVDRFERVESPREGSLVLLRCEGHRSHVGVCVGGTWFLHTLRGVCSALERFDSIGWSRRIEGFYEVVPR